MNKYNLTWIAFANKKRCRLTKAINTLVVISWRKLNVVLLREFGIIILCNKPAFINDVNIK